ncbi:hypothetical protein ONZ45_g14567 [Pleurotus djamor]|nr:hypothetical protein ONZ45_g14567 [Pleurotus djamor]
MTDGIQTLSEPPFDAPSTPNPLPEAEVNDHESGPSTSAIYVNNLYPPIGTSWWRKQEITVMKDQPILWHKDQSRKIAIFNWSVDAYIYTVNAKPNSTFKKNHGAVYAVLVHRGSCEILPAPRSLDSAQTQNEGVNGDEIMESTGTPFKFKVFYRVSLPRKYEGGEAIKQLPPSNTATKDGSSWKYPITLRQTMQMFRYNGTEPFSFEATYEDALNLDKSEQEGEFESSEVSWKIITNNDRPTKVPISSLSIFRFKSPEAVNLRFFAMMLERWDMSGGSHAENKELDCSFVAPEAS